MIKFAIFVTRQIHWLVILFVLFGYLLDSQTWLIIHALTGPLIIIHWATNNGKCYLTVLENKLREIENPGIKLDSSEEGFISRFFRNTLNLNLPDKAIEKIIRFSIFAASSASIFKIIF